MRIKTNLYFKIVKQILDQAITDYNRRTGKSIPEIDNEIAEHIRDTSSEYRNPDPNINYNDPLCRLGYIFTHVGANAVLFEKTIRRSTDLQLLIDDKAPNSIHFCTVGGGPGTELLGLTEYLLVNNIECREIHFTVLDNIPEWGEIWNYLAEASRNILDQNFVSPPTIHRSFYPMDVVESSSYSSYAWLLEKADMIVFNYLISENKVRLPMFTDALSEMIFRTKSGCYFVTIDRLERNTSFHQYVIDIFNNSGLEILETFKFDGVMSDSESTLEDYLTRFESRPRRWFETLHKGYPTVFAIVAKKP